MSPSPIKWAFVKECFTGLIKETSKAILAPLGPWVAGLIALALPTVFLWWQAGSGFLKTDHATPGWLLLLTTSIFLLVAFLLVRQQITIWKLKPPKEKPYLWHGLEWTLTPEFWLNYRHFLVNDLDPGFLRASIIGPLCSGCKRDVTAAISRLGTNQCPYCLTQFDLIPFQRDRIAAGDRGDRVLRQLVYIEAQAAARRKEI